MQKFHEEFWLSHSIALLNGEISKEKKNAFLKELETSEEYLEKFRILKRIWHTEFKDVPNHTPDWDRLKHAINQEFALTYYLRKVNLEKFDKKSVLMLNNIKSELPKEEICCIEQTINRIYSNNEPVLRKPKSDLWSKIETSIKNDLQEKKPLVFSGKNIRIALVRNKSVVLTAIASAAAVIALFLVLFVFMPENTQKIVKTTKEHHNTEINQTDPSVEEKENVKPDIDKNNNIVRKEVPDDDSERDEAKDNNFKTTASSTIKIKDRKEIPSNIEKKNTENKVEEEKDTPGETIKEEPKAEENKNGTEKKKTEESNNATNPQEFVYKTKYKVFDPEKMKSSTPNKFGVDLNFSFDSEENEYNTLEFKLPIKNEVYKISTDKNNNLRVDFNNDGYFENTYSSSTYKSFKLQYDDGKINKIQYRIKFVKTKEVWKILPASGRLSKNAYQDSDILFIDANINGFFNDINSDFIQFDEEEIQVLSNANISNNKWLGVVPDKSGLNVRIKKYLTKHIGTLQIQSEYENDVKLKWISIVGDSASITISAKHVKELNLPEGEYRILKGVVGNDKSEIEFEGAEIFKFKVLPAFTTKIEIGGELVLSTSKYKVLNGKLEIDRSNLKLVGTKSGERYHTLRTKHKEEIMNIKRSFITHEVNLKYKRNLNIQGTKDSKVVFLNMPRLSEPGIHNIWFVEETFSEFLTGKSIVSKPIRIDRN